jgi:glycosyltransferase involved in cell wall biosynthesis
MTIYLTVTSDLSYDQRMQRICTSLAAAGHRVVLIGRRLKSSIPLTPSLFEQKRLKCFFEKGKFFYAEYNIRLFFFLLFKRMDCICAIDLDTILPCYFISKLKKVKRVYDAHELFCEMKEIVTRPAVYAAWKKIERFAVPKFKKGYTVNQPIADEFNKMYGVQYSVIRNVPVLKDYPAITGTDKFILYQGAVNEGRCFENLIPAMQQVDCKLVVCGDGNFMAQARQLVLEHSLKEKVIFKGNILPDELRLITAQAYIGINLVENNGLSNYLSLANKFFDYIHAGIPQLTMAYPAYSEINTTCNVAVLIKDTSPENIAQQLNNLLKNEVLYNELKANCRIAREKYNWQIEEKMLLDFYKQIEMEISQAK